MDGIARWSNRNWGWAQKVCDEKCNSTAIGFSGVQYQKEEKDGKNG